nr:protein crumbs-like [Parasteatoda tepidariorum]
MTNILTLLLFSTCFICSVCSFSSELSNEKDACAKICQNGAKCTKIGKYEFCKCLPGTFSDDCGIVPDCIDEVIKCNEKSDSVCGYNVRLEVAECICNNSNLAYDLKTETCKVTCNETEPCKNGGTCKTVGNYHFCDCIEGTFGDTCESVNSCVEETLICNSESGAVCGFNLLDKRAECLCSNGLKYDSNIDLCRSTAYF